MKEFKLNDHEFIALCDLLKTIGFCQTGGQAKSVIFDGMVKVDGEVELRKRGKIVANQIVEFQGESVKVTN